MAATLAPAAGDDRPAIGWAGAWSLTAAGGLVLLGLLMVAVWPKRPEMGDRFLIPLGSIVALYFLRPRWQATPRRPTRTGLFGVAIGGMAFAPAWFLIVQVGPRTLLLWWLSMALALAVVGLTSANHGWRRTGIVLFPLLFTFFALPTPDVLQGWLLGRLKGITTAGAAAILPWVGVPAQRDGTGFTLSLPSGQLGVVDACSGALSLTSLLAISVFTAYIRITLRRDFSLPQAIVLVALTVPIVVVSNTVRVIATGVLQETIGPEAVTGWRHETLGYLVILIGFGLIIGLSNLLARPRGDPPIREPGTPASSAKIETRRRGWIAFGMLLPAAAVCLWAEQFRAVRIENADLSTIKRQLPHWEGSDLPVPADVAEVLKCDQIICRRYESALGHSVLVYVMFWATPASTAHIHHPDVCWPSRGCTVAESRVRPVLYAAGREPLGVSVRHYLTADGKRQIVFYWTQNGSSVLPDGREKADGSSEYGWIPKMLRGQRAPRQVARLSVLLGADAAGQAADQEDRVAGLSALIAADVYRVCPWAAPDK